MPQDVRNNTSLAATAAGYQRLGLSVFDLPHGSKTPDRGRRTYAAVPADAAEVARMFRDEPRNIAIITGRPSGNLLGLDCDTPDALAEQRRRLASSGIGAWLVQRPPNGSDHDGGGSLVMRTDQPAASTKCGAVDVLGEGCYFMAPPSEHPDGGTYVWVELSDALPVVSLGDLSWLDLRPAPETGVGPRRMPRLASRLLHGDPQTVAKYATRSEAEAALCASLASAGYEFGDAVALLQTHPGPGKYTELAGDDARNAVRYLRLTWGTVTSWLEEENQSDAQRRAMRLLRWAEGRPWPGRTGSTDRAVYVAHCQIVARTGSEPHHAACRNLAELAGVGYVTATRANHRLMAQGLLELADVASTTLANRYRLAGHNETLIHAPHVSECFIMSRIQNHDAFRRGALNPSGAEVLASLLDADDATEAATIAQETGRDIRTVKRRLGDLYTFGIAEPLGRGAWRLCIDRAELEARLDEIAEYYGTAGTLARDQAKHVRERRMHRLALQRGQRIARGREHATGCPRIAVASS